MQYDLFYQSVVFQWLPRCTFGKYINEFKQSLKILPKLLLLHPYLGTDFKSLGAATCQEREYHQEQSCRTGHSSYCGMYRLVMMSSNLSETVMSYQRIQYDVCYVTIYRSYVCNHLYRLCPVPYDIPCVF